jgi:hypothetical protein
MACLLFPLIASLSHSAIASDREVEWNGELEALLEDTPLKPETRLKGIEMGLNAFMHEGGLGYGLDGGFPFISEESGRSLHLKLEFDFGESGESSSREFRYRSLRAGLSSRAPLTNTLVAPLDLKAEILLSRSSGLYGEEEIPQAEFFPTLRGGIELGTGKWREGLNFEWNRAEYAPHQAITFRVGYSF